MGGPWGWFFRIFSEKSFKIRPNSPYGWETSSYSLLQQGVINHATLNIPDLWKWVEIHGKYYHFSSAERVSIDLAESKCTKNGGKLFEPKNESIYNEILIGNSNHGSYFGWWIGIMSDGNKFVYRSDKTEVGWTNWNDGESHNSADPGKDCVRFGLVRLG